MFERSNLEFFRRDRGMIQGILDTANPLKREENLRAMADWCMSAYDDDAKVRTQQRFGDTPDPLDADGSAFFAGFAIARTMGIEDNPAAYWYLKGEDVPDGFEDWKELYTAIGNEGMDWAKRERDRKAEAQRQLKAEQDKLMDGVRSYINGRSADMYLDDLVGSLKYSEVPDKYIKSVKRARAAMMWVEQIEDQSILERSVPEGLVDMLLREDGEVDGSAVRLFSDAVREAAKAETGTKESRFWGNVWDGLGRAVADQAELTHESMTLSSGEMLADFGGGITVPVTPMQPEDAERNRRFHKLSRDRKYIAGIIRELDDARTKTDASASIVTKAINGAGRAVGDTSVWMVPYIGHALGPLALFNDAYKRELAKLDWGDLDDREQMQRAFGEAAAKTAGGTAAELSFGAASFWGRTGIFGRLFSRMSGAQSRVLQRALSRPGQAMLKAMDKGDLWLARTAAKSKIAHYVSSHTPARLGLGAVSLWGEENIGENFVQSPAEYIARSTMRLFGANVDEGQITILQDIAQATTDPETSGGTFVFGLLMHAVGMRGLMREVADYKANYKQFMLAGMKEEHARELVRIRDKDEFCRKADAYFASDVVQDPEGAKERANKQGKAMMSEQEAEANRVTGALDALMTLRGIGSIKQVGEEDKYELTRLPEQEGGQEAKMTLTGAQLDAYIQVSVDDHDANLLREIQSRIVGEQSAKDASKLGYVDMLDMSEAAEEFRRDIEENGGLTMRGIKALSKRAVDAIKALEDQGLATEEARATVDESVMPDVQLESVANLAGSLEHRIKEAARSGEITRKDAANKLRGRGAVTNVFRLADAKDVTRSHILYAKGRATAADVFEDVKEAALAKYMKDNKLDWAQLWRQLQEADKVLGGKLGTYKGDARTSMDVVEAFSILSLSSMLSNIDDLAVPGHVKTMAQYAKGSLAATSALIDMGDAWHQFVDSEEGQKFVGENGLLENVLAEAGTSMSSLLRGMKFEASSADAVIAAVQGEGRAMAAKEAVSKNPKVVKLRKELKRLKEKLEDARNEGEAHEILNEIDNTEALIAAEETGIYVTPSYDWTARNEDGLADTAGISASLAGNPLHIYANGIQYTRNGSFYTADDGIKNRRGLSHAQEGSDSSRPADGRPDAGAGEGVQQAQYRDRSELHSRDAGDAEKLLRTRRRVRAVTRRLHRFGGADLRAAEKEGFYTGDLCELDKGEKSAALFARAIEEARQSRGVKGECVYVYPVEEYAGMRLFLTPDGMSGMALKEDGDMVSVFSHKDQKRIVEGSPASSLIALAINEGAIKCDCYGRHLVTLYGQFGYRAVAKDRFNPEYASEAMRDDGAMRANFPAEGGKPDVIYLVYVGNRERVLDEFDPSYRPTYQDELEYTDYDECLARQTAAVEEKKKALSEPGSSYSLAGVDPVIADVRDEMRAIREKAISDGIYLLAPNGKDTKLTPHQWEIVRTLGFKKWFGDWENDPENSSKIVDANGEPKVVHHGTYEDFTAFEPSEKWSRGGGAIWFSESEETAKTYGRFDGKTMPVFIRAINPKCLDAKGKTHKAIKAGQHQGTASIAAATNRKRFDAVIFSDIKDYAIFGGGDIPAATSIAVFEPTQIKSAVDNRGSFDPDNPDITFSLSTESREKVAAAWVQQLDDYLSGRNPQKRRDLRVGPTPAVLRMLGADGYDLVMTPGVVDKVTTGKHSVPLDELYRLPDALHEPLAVFESVTEADSMVVLTELKEGDDNVVVAVHLNSQTSNGSIVVNRVASIYGKENKRALLKMPALYLDIKKARPWLTSDRLQLPVEVHSGAGSKRRVLKPDNLVKWKKKNALPDNTYSLASRSVLAPLLQRIHEKRIEKLHGAMKTHLERWNVLTARWGQPGEKLREGEAIEAFGSVVSLVGEINRALPEGYRFATAPYLRKAYEIAKAIKAGEATMADILAHPEQYDKLLRSRAVGSTASMLAQEARMAKGREAAQGLQGLMRELLDRTGASIERYEKARVAIRMNALIERVLPKKAPNGKYQKGKMSADGYKRLYDIIAMTRADAETVTARMDELQGLIAAADDQAKIDKYASELQDWSVYGCLADMPVVKARAAEKAITAYIESGRTQWEIKLEYDRLRLKKSAQDLTSALGQASMQDLLDAEEIQKGTRAKAKIGFLDGFLSFSQFLNTLSRVPGLKGFARAQITRIAEANVALRNMEIERNEAVMQLIADVTGRTSEKDQAKYIVEFKKSQRTGISLTPRVKVEYRLKIDEARYWVKLTPREREAERRKIRKDAKERGLAVEGIIPEDVTADFVLKLSSLDAGKIKARKYITVEKEILRDDKKTSDLRMSRAQAAYAVLLYEQTEYRRNFERAGFGPEQIKKLYDYLGDDGLKIAYGLRDIVRRRGEELARVYEEREGVPFPAVDNYFRACFRVDHKDKQARFGDEQNMLGGGAKYAMLIPRRAHNLDLALDMDVMAVFKASQAETENYIATSEITSDWRRMLADKDLSGSIKARLGAHYLKQLRDWLRVLDGASAAEGAAILAQSQVVAKFQSARAVALLAYNSLTIFKQFTALLHGSFAGETSFWRWLSTVPRMATPSGFRRAMMILDSDTFRARESRGDVINSLLSFASNQNWSSVQRFAMGGMKFLEKADVFANAASMAVLYEAKADELREYNEANPEDTYSEQEIEQLCMESVTRAMELVAQPLTATQKSAASQNNSWAHKLLFFMASESVNKFGAFVMHLQNGQYGQAIALWATMSIAEQTVAYLYNALLGGDDEDAWKKYLLLAPVAMIGGVPLIGAAVESSYRLLTGQRIYMGTGGSVIDTAGAWRAWKKTYDGMMGRRQLTYADWCRIIVEDARVAGSLLGAGIGSRNKAINSIASWMLGLAAAANATKPVVNALDK